MTSEEFQRRGTQIKDGQALVGRLLDEWASMPSWRWRKRWTLFCRAEANNRLNRLRLAALVRTVALEGVEVQA